LLDVCTVEPTDLGEEPEFVAEFKLKQLSECF